MMVVKIDLSHLPDGLKSVIINNKEFSSLPKDNHYDTNERSCLPRVASGEEGKNNQDIRGDPFKE